jgi:hypothetical protein
VIDRRIRDSATESTPTLKKLDLSERRDTANILRFDPLHALLGSRLANPWVLGVVLAFLVALMIVLGPSSESRFIYTDF